jgi:hypothetical protein
MSTHGWKKALLTAGLGTAMALGGVLIASTPAEARDNCSKQIQKEQRELNRAIQRYGYSSRQANEERREIRRLQSTCGGGFFGNRDDRRWRRGDGDNDRDDRTWRQGNGNKNRDNRRWRQGNGDRDRDDRSRRDRNRDWNHDRDKDRDRDRWRWR